MEATQEGSKLDACYTRTKEKSYRYNAAHSIWTEHSGKQVAATQIIIMSTSFHVKC